MPNAVIIDIVRSPMGKGKPGGALSSLHPVDLLAQVIKALVERNDLDPATVDDVLVGCVGQVGEQSGTPGRHAWLAAGLPESVPSTTIERRCGSGQQAIDFAVQGVMAGAYDIAIAGGIEQMSRIPMGTNRKNSDPPGPTYALRYPETVNQGVAAELIADKYGFTREQLDVLSTESHARAHTANTSDLFVRDIAPIHLPDGSVVDRDESIRPGTTVELLATLPPVFGTEEMRQRLPHIDWKVTAGNSSQVTDAAGAALIMSEERARALGLRPRARIVSTAVVGSDPILMLTGIIPATQKVLDRAGMSVDQIDLVEVNEAFAPVPLSWMSEFGVESERVNPLGGAIALGHPLGASGLRLFSSLLTGLEQRGGRYGLQTMCEAAGMANAMIIERL